MNKKTFSIMIMFALLFGINVFAIEASKYPVSFNFVLDKTVITPHTPKLFFNMPIKTDGGRTYIDTIINRVYSENGVTGTETMSVYGEYNRFTGRLNAKFEAHTVDDKDGKTTEGYVRGSFSGQVNEDGTLTLTVSAPYTQATYEGTRPESLFFKTIKDYGNTYTVQYSTQETVETANPVTKQVENTTVVTPEIQPVEQPKTAPVVTEQSVATPSETAEPVEEQKSNTMYYVIGALVVIILLAVFYFWVMS